MNKRLWFFVSIIFLSVETAFAACAQQSTVNFSPPPLKITNLNHTQTYDSVFFAEMPIVFSCDPWVRLRGRFIAKQGNTDLTRYAPFGVNASTIMINGSSANAQTLNAAKEWLARNFMISFRMGQSIGSNYSIDITSLDLEHPIIPIWYFDTIRGNDRGLEFSTGASLSNLGVDGWPQLTTTIYQATIRLIDSTKPSADIIAALDGDLLTV